MSTYVVEILSPTQVQVETGAPAITQTVEVFQAGPPGPCGERGVPGLGSNTYIHRQDAPEAVWAIAHGLDNFPSVTIVDSAGDMVLGGHVDYIDSNTISVSFSAAFSGKAYLN